MTFEVEVAGRVRRVAIEALDDAGAFGGRFRVVLDDGSFEIDARRTELGWSMIYPDGRVVDAAVTEQLRGGVVVQLPQVDVWAVVDGRRFRGDPLDASRTANDSAVSAPMPGRVVRLLVKPGDEVAARQGLVVVEAMKMENELVAPRAGRISEVLVTEGESVEAGRLLMRLA